MIRRWFGGFAIILELSRKKGMGVLDLVPHHKKTYPDHCKYDGRSGGAGCGGCAYCFRPRENGADETRPDRRFFVSVRKFIFPAGKVFRGGNFLGPVKKEAPGFIPPGFLQAPDGFHSCGFRRFLCGGSLLSGKISEPLCAKD
jgi:hypothetical protein